MIKSSIPVLPLRDIVVFPQMVAPLFVGRKLSINALNYVMSTDKKILLITQKNSEIDNPNAKHLYNFGTIAKVLQLLKLPDGTIKVLVEGIERAKVKNIAENEDFISANFNLIKTEITTSSKIKALMKVVITQFSSYQKINKKIPLEVINSLNTYSNPSKLADVVISNLQFIHSIQNTYQKN